MITHFYAKKAQGAERLSLWAADDKVAQVFKCHSDAVAALLEIPSGISEAAESGYEIDLPAFDSLLTEAVAHYEATDQGILRSLTVGFIATALVLLDRATQRMPIAQQQALWAGLRDQLAALMPH